jgi:hypothetical protein
MLHNVMPLTEVADARGLSILCQDKIFFVKTKLHVAENQQFWLAAVS